jgi:endoglucanase
LLPGVEGFVKIGHVVVNPSYYAFPMIRQLSLAFPSPVWAQLEQNGVRMISEAKFGKWSLPSDWLQVRRADGAVSMAESFPQRFSYDALRIPLFLAWSGLAPDTTRAISRFWSDGCGAEPSYADLKSGVVMGHFTLLGAKSIARLIASSGVERDSLAFDQIAPTDSYYSSSLHLLTRIAAEEIALRV